MIENLQNHFISKFKIQDFSFRWNFDNKKKADSH
jgi:hypothetical protein